MTRSIGRRGNPFIFFFRELLDDQFCNFNLTSHHFNHPIRFLSQPPILKPYKTPNLTHTLTTTPISKLVSFASSPDANTDENPEFERDDVVDEDISSESAGCSSPDLETIRDILRTGSVQEKSQKLQRCRGTVTPELVADVLSGTRNDWETAFTFFLWAGKQPNYAHSLREYHSMIAILGKFRKFDTAWSLIDEMKAASIATPHTLLIMIRKYAAVHDVARAISAFYAHRRFNFKLGMEEFQGLLSALCRYKNVKDAEHLLFCNASAFPLNTKSFNIILNGWCNVIGDLREGKRIWKVMSMRGIEHDVYSYASIMSCHSKMNNLKVVLDFYERMKQLGKKPDRKVYNAVIHALAKGRLVKEARNVMERMEGEGVRPDEATYNSLIMPLCKSRMLEEARKFFDEMVERGLRPTVRTFHGFFRVFRTGEEVFDLLRTMYKVGCCPSHETYVMLIRKFCRWREVETVFYIWDEMRENGLDPDRSCYVALIHGLFLNGRLEEAHKYYVEMKEKDLLPEPSVDAMIRAWLEGKKDGNEEVVMLRGDYYDDWDVRESGRVELRKNRKDSDFLRRPELRSVTRERGFSFWENKVFD
ncbi:pentatricopeptide repeat-containing protein At5g15010, mitochondrial [Andrographis paniculata]|uniref:pentatricopeptide repeat-containing protein At5g15010, mitochondrial n=1 Tax=Andrographis paniculata TaxID=175694 RepID=UPI0021E7A58B|nr:pentatricopeptide repeat-containing protein At5g15010, mitochondrial [Andrographis paniculata]